MVLRGMQVLPKYQRQGVGKRLLTDSASRVDHVVCYCIPWNYLEPFYASGGFERCEPEDAPRFLEERYFGYLQDGLDVIVMRRQPH